MPQAYPTPFNNNGYIKSIDSAKDVYCPKKKKKKSICDTVEGSFYARGIAFI